MVDGYVSWEDTVDPSGCNTDDPINYWKSSRDPERTPFQWNSDKNAGMIINLIIKITSSIYRIQFADANSTLPNGMKLTYEVLMKKRTFI